MHSNVSCTCLDLFLGARRDGVAMSWNFIAVRTLLEHGQAHNTRYHRFRTSEWVTAILVAAKAQRLVLRLDAVVLGTDMGA